VRVLIYHSFALEEGGGPAAYLKHYRDYLRTIDEDRYVFLCDIFDIDRFKDPFRGRSRDKKTGKLRPHQFSLTRIVERLKALLPGGKSRIKNLKTGARRISKSLPGDFFDLHQFDALQFHSSCDLFQARSMLRSYGGKVLLMSHSPKPWHREYVEDTEGVDPRRVGKRFRDRLRSIDKSAFEMADALVFPCAEAMEPYRQLWPEFNDIASGKKLIFAPTPFEKETRPHEQRELLHRLLDFSESAVVAFFAGRHNAVKGYDLLCEAGASILDRWPSLHIVCAGIESAVIKCNHPRWHELGWRKDVGALMASADFYILPNRMTYFDLVLLEAMSCGLPIVLSETGGNRYFLRYPQSGFRFFHPGSAVSLQSAIDSVMAMDAQKRRLAGAVNMGIIQSDFGFDRFHATYNRGMTSLFEDPADLQRVD